MTFYEEIKNIERIIDCIESDNRENGIMPNIEYGVMPYELELPSLLRELIELKSLTGRGGINMNTTDKLFIDDLRKVEESVLNVRLYAMGNCSERIVQQLLAIERSIAECRSSMENELNK